MINREELEKSITNPMIQIESKTKTYKYDTKGQLGPKLSEQFAVAIQVDTSKNKIFKVKMMRGGHLYNPLKENSSIDYSLTKKDRITGEDKFQFREVNQKVFDLYLQFLKTGHDSLLIQAERAL